MDNLFAPFIKFQFMPATALIPALLLILLLFRHSPNPGARPLRLVMSCSLSWVAYAIWEYRVKIWAENEVVPVATLFAAALAAVLWASPGTAMAGELTRIAVISDINGRYGSTGYDQRIATAVERIIGLQPALVISTGDMIAGQRSSPKLQRAELEAMWQSFHEQVRKPLEAAGIPLLMTPGNHDASAYPGFELEREAYTAYHTTYPPALKPLPGGHFPYHYAVSFEHLLLVSLDATASGPLPRSQLGWLSMQLNAGDQYRASLVFGHLPLQPISIGRERDVITDLALESLLQHTKVTLYLSGHHHAYYPGRRLGVDMLSIGNLGGNQRQLAGTNMTTGFSFVMLEFDAGGNASIVAFSGPAFDQAIDMSALPEQLGTGQAMLRRRDLAAPPAIH